MKEYIGHMGNRVIIDGERIHIKQAFIQEELTFSDILNCIFVEPAILTNGVLEVQTQKNYFKLYYTKKQEEQFRELYEIILSKTDDEKSDVNHSGNRGVKIMDNIKKYVVLQVVLKEAFVGTGSGNLVELENVINAQAARGYRLHTISTTSSGSKGMLGGDRIQATMVFERL